MARRRSVVRRAGAGRRITPAAILAFVFIVGGMIVIGLHFGRGDDAGRAAMEAGDDSATVISNAANGPARATGNFFDNLTSMWNSGARIRELEKENRDLTAWKALAERLAERNARYEALLRMPKDAFGEGADVENSIAAQLVLDSGGPFTRTLVANAGADHGVKVGYIAVNENGLIGRVVSVGRRSARVLMLDDYNSRIPVMGEASRVRAVLAGQATQPPNLLLGPAQLEAPRLDFIVGAAALREGERMVTSGDGGLYPRGIAVGMAHRTDDGGWRVVLAASQGPIDFVRIIPYVGVEAPEATEVADSGPPANARSAVAAVVPQANAPAPRPQPTTNAATPPAQTPRAQTQPAATPNATPAQPATPAPSPTPAPQEAGR